jgi:hypothetical protein
VNAAHNPHIDNTPGEIMSESEIIVAALAFFAGALLASLFWLVVLS